MACSFNILTRVGISVVHALGNRGAVVDAGDVGNEHVREMSLAATNRSGIVSFLLSLNNLSWPAIHEELAIACVVDP